MSYTINKTDGTIVATVADGQIDQSSTSITLIGKNFSGFGEYLNENLVKMLENFASVGTEPTTPLTGQLWYDAEENRVKVYSGTEWKAVGTSALATSRPLDISTGDFWFNTTDNQLFFYDGSRDYLIAPDYSVSQGQTGFKVETIEDRLYLSYPELPVLGPPVCGKGLFWVKDPNRVDHIEKINYYHVWLEKYYYKTDENFRNQRIKELKEELISIIPKLI